MATDTKHKVKIRIRAFPYYVDDIDPVSGRSVRREEIAVRGEEIELNEEDYRRALKFEAIALPDSPSQEAPVDVASNIDIATVEEVAEWLKVSKPTIDETVEAADGDTMKAKKLLDAENLVSGRQPRAGVVTKLEEIIKGDSSPPE